MKKMLTVISLALMASLSTASGAPAAGNSTAANNPAPAKGETEKPKPAANVRIGYLDMIRIAKESGPGKAARARLKAEGEKLRSRVSARQKELEKFKSSVEAKLPSLSAGQREAKGKEFRKKVADYQKFVQDAEKKLNAMEADLSNKVFAQVRQKAQEYGQANGYSVIVIQKELIYSGPAVEKKDITDDIIKLLGK